MMEELLNFSLPESLWWEQIAGPARLVAAMESSLSEGHGVVCEITSALSYRGAFRDNVAHWLSENDIAVEQVECDDYQGEDIEGYLINKLFPSQLNTYNRRRNPLFMKNNSLLDRRVIWIRRVSEQYVKQWIQYISSYRSRDMMHGLFVMEVIQTDSQLKRMAQNLHFLSVDDFISQADLRLFVSILADRELKVDEGIRAYIVELITDLCVFDAELACRLLELPDWYLEDPCNALSRLYDAEYASSPRGEEAWHPFYLLRHDQIRQLQNRVWTAQIRVGYPRIEIERCEFIQIYYEQIQQALSTQYCDLSGNAKYFCDSDGNRYTDPYDMEIGMLCKLMHLIRENDGMRLLYIPDQELRDRLFLLRDFRNNLAHLETCEGRAFCTLLSSEQKYMAVPALL